MSPQTGRTAVLLVHGVGDPRPGDTLREFVAALTAHPGAALAIHEPQETHIVVDRDDYWPSPTDRQDERGGTPPLSFPLHVQRASENGREVVFAEVFWGSASKVVEGTWGLLNGLLRLILGMRGIIDGARGSAQENPWLNRLAALGSHILVGPIFAVNVLLFLISIAYVRLEVVGGGGGQQTWDPALTVGLMSLVLVVASTLLRREARGQDASRPDLNGLGWSCLVLGGGLLVTSVSHLATEARLLLPLLASLSLPSVEASASAALWTTWGRLMIGTLAFLFVLEMAILIALLSACAASAVVRPAASGESNRAPLAALAMGLTVQNILWVTVVPAVWIATMHVANNGFERTLVFLLFQEAAPGDPYQWLAVLGIVVAALVIWGRRCRWSSSHGGEATRTDRLPNGEPPRLIVGGLLAGTILVGGFAGASWNAFLMIRYLGERVAAFPNLHEPPLLRAATSAGATPALVILFLFLGALVMGPLRAVLDIGNDVTSYLYQNAEDERRRKERSGRYPTLGLDAGEGRSQPGTSIRLLFWLTLNHVWERFAFDRLVVISHSQGTVIAIDELAHSNVKGLFEPEPRTVAVDLVTMGSPFQHVYQHYFPATYHALAAARWDVLRKRVSSWLNLYRIDDFVGTRIDDAKVQNVALERGGHTRYWQSRDVIDELLKAGVFQRHAVPTGRGDAPLQEDE